MSTFSLNEWVLDQLAGNAASNLSAHTPDFGPAWVNGPNSAPKLDGTGGIYTTAVVAGELGSALVTGAVPTAAQFAQCQVRNLSNLAVATKCGVGLRWHPPADPEDPELGYALYYSSAAAGWILSKLTGGMETVLATYNAAGQAIGVGETGGGILRVEGTSLLAITNGVTHAPVTDNAIAGPGQLAVIQVAGGAQAAGTGIHTRAILGAYVP